MPGKGQEVLDALRAMPGAEPVLARLAGRPEAWVVGGAVRDALLGRAPRDLDVVVEGDAGALARVLGTVLEDHDRFGTLVVDAGEAHVNVATARSETYSRPGALPDVEPAGIDEDLERRDFTSNAIAVRVADGALRAVDGALEDVDARTLRALHEGSFVDDPTRALRLARYRARLGFGIDPVTERLAGTAELETVSGSRVGAEVRLMAAEPDPVAAIASANALGLLAKWTIDEALARRAVVLLGEAGSPGLTALAAAGVGEEEDVLRVRLDAWAFPGPERDRVALGGSRAPALAAALAATSRPSEIAAAVHGLPLEAVALAGALGPDQPARRWITELRHGGLEITGDDLIAAGVPQGPEIGRRLARALAARRDGEIEPGRDAELRAALSD